MQRSQPLLISMGLRCACWESLYSSHGQREVKRFNYEFTTLLFQPNHSIFISSCCLRLESSKKGQDPIKLLVMDLPTSIITTTTFPPPYSPNLLLSLNTILHPFMLPLFAVFIKKVSISLSSQLWICLPHNQDPPQNRSTPIPMKSSLPYSN